MEHLEIERKFLLRELPPHVRGFPVLELEQGWLPGERLRERLRRTHDEGGERFFRAVKLPAGPAGVRMELEEQTSPELFRALWPFTAGQRVRKRRFRVPHGALVWEIDQFTDRELVLAEVELPEHGAEAAIPGWLVPYVVREVTDEPGYLNLNLAR